MATNKATIIIGADASGVSSGVSKAKGELNSLKSSAMSIGKALGGIFAIRQVGRMAGDIIQVTAEFGALKEALNGIKDANESVDQLVAKSRELAKLPSVGLNEVVKAFVQLKAAGSGTNEAETTIREIANAVTASGGGVEQFERAIFALSQIRGNGKVLGQDLNQLKNAIPSLGAAMKTAFGSTTTDAMSDANKEADVFIKKLNEVLSAGARIDGGLKNDINNLSQAFKELKIAIGSAFGDETKSAIDAVREGLDGVNAVAQMENSGLMKQLFGLSAKEAASVAVQMAKGSFGGLGGAMGKLNEIAEKDAAAKREREAAMLPNAFDIAPAIRGKGSLYGKDVVSIGDEAYGPDPFQMNFDNREKEPSAFGMFMKGFTDNSETERKIAIEQTIGALNKGIDLSKERRDGLSNGPVVADSLTRIGGGGGAWGGSNPMVRKMDQQITKLEQQISLLEDIKAKGPLTMGQ